MAAKRSRSNWCSQQRLVGFAFVYLGTSGDLVPWDALLRLP